MKWQQTYNYRIEAYAVDKAGNPHGSAGIPAFTGYYEFDSNPPTSHIVFPTSLATPNAFGAGALNTLYGTSADGIGESGINYVQYRLQDTITGKWWCSSALAPGNSCYANPSNSFITLTVGENPPWNVGGSTTTPSWQVWQATGIPWAQYNGDSFALDERAVDAAANIEASTNSVSFVYDSSAPATSVSYPLNNVAYSSQTASVSGIVFDQPQPNNAGVFQVSLGIQRQSDGKWWTSGGWNTSRADISQPAVSLNTVANPNTWSYAIPAGFWTTITNADQFLVYAWGGDNVQNEAVSLLASAENIESSTTLKLSFNYDVQPPSSTITSPADQVWYSNQTGVNLPTLTGNAADNPPTHSAGVASVAVEIRDENTCPSCQYWYESLQSWQSGSTFNPSIYLASTWTFTNTNLTPKLTSGHTYRVRSKGRDASVDSNNNPNGTYETPPDIIIQQQTSPAYANVHFFNYDTDAPTTTITSPSNGSVTNNVLSITGIAYDNPGNFNAGISTIQVAVCAGNPCGANTYLSANNASGQFNASITYFPATVTGFNAGIYSWTVPMPSVPFLNNTVYQILARSSDTVNNLETPLAAPAEASDHISFTFSSPPPTSAITSPDTTVPNFQPNAVNLQGTAQYATTVQVQIVDCGPDLQCNNGNDDLAWNGSQFVSTSTFNDFVGVTTFNSGNGAWQMIIGAGGWNGNRNYRITSQAVDTVNSLTQAIKPTRSFVVDSSAPVAALTNPPSQNYLNALTSLSATITDVSPGQVSPTAGDVYYTVNKLGSSLYWNWQASTFTTAGPNTVLTATLASGDYTNGLWSYTTTYFQTGAAWVSGQNYEVQLFAKDKAGNPVTSTLQDFTFDTTAPTATLTVPSVTLANFLPAVSGTALDNNTAPPGNKTVQVSILRNSDGRYFVGASSAFLTSGTPVWNDVTMAGGSSYLSPSATYWVYAPANLDTKLAQETTTYTIMARAIDVAGNPQSTFAAGVSSVTILYDNQAPTVAISFPQNGQAYRPGVVGLSTVPFTGSDADNPATPQAGMKPVGGVQLRLSYLLAGSSYYWSPGAVKFDSSILPANAWFNTDDNSWAYGSIVPMQWPASSYAYFLEARGTDKTTAGDGTGTGNISLPTTAGFIVDNIPPTGSIAWPSADATLSSATLQMTGPQADDLSGVSLTQVEVSTGLGASKYYWTGSSFTLNQTWITTTTAPTWFYTISNSALAPGNGSRYYLRAQLTDVAGNVFDTPVTTFTYNTTAPTIGISTPVNNGFYSAVQISTPFGGAASPSGAPNVVVSTIILTLQDLTVGTSYYNGSSWISGAATFPAQGTVASWSFNNAALTFVNDHQYQLTATATDSSQVSASSNTTFVYDVQKPTSTVTSPNTAYVTAWTTISGTANDKLNSPTYPSGLPATGVSVAVQQVGGSWWNGSAFSGVNPAYQTAAFVGMSSGAWSYTLPAGLQSALVSGTSYYVVSRSTDNAGNTEFGLLVGNIPGGTGFTVAYDTAPPTAVITLPVLASTSGVTTFTSLAGTASGDLGVSTVRVAIQNMANGLWLDNNTTNFTVGPQSNPNFVPVTYLSANATSWTYAPAVLASKLTGDAKYLLVAEALAPSGLTQNTFTVGASSIQVIIDATAPDVTISVPSPVGTPSYKRANIGKSPSSLLSGTVNDPGTYPAGTKDYQIRLSYVYNGDTYYYDGTQFSSTTVNATTAWQSRNNGNGAWTYPFSIVWPAAGTSHLMKLEVRGEDNALSESGAGPGNVGTPSTVGTDIVNFNLDDVPPSGAIAWPGTNTAVSSSTIQMTGPATDDLSGVALTQVEVSTGLGASKYYWTGSSYTLNQTWIATTTANPWYYTIPSGALSSGVYYLRLQLTDVAGNPFTSQTSTVTYDITPPLVAVTTPVAGVFYSAVLVSTPFGGTASDADTSVSTVAVSVTDLDDGPSYFNGNTYAGGGPFYLPAQGTVNLWTFNNANLYFVNDHRYDISAKATDIAGNSAMATHQIFYDVKPATSVITTPAPPYMNGLATIAGTATDNPGNIYTNPSKLSTGAVSIAIKQTGSNWWNGSDFITSVDPVYYTVTNTTTTNPNTWTYSLPGALQSALTSGKSYRLISRSTDTAGNTEFPVGNSNVPAGVGVTVLYDSATAASVATFPLNNHAYPTIAALSGTADDTLTGSGVQEVDIALLDGINRYWAGPVTGWTACGTGCVPWQSASFVGMTSGTWQYNNFNGTTFGSNYNYRLYTRALDKAGNTPADPNFTLGGLAFQVDNTAPVSFTTSPVNASNLHGLGTVLAGTANDFVGGSVGSGVSTALVRIGRSDGLYFDPLNTSFDSLPSSINFPLGPATLSVTTFPNYNWTLVLLPAQAAALTEGYQYHIESQSTDNAGNFEVAYNTITFIVDNSSPTATVTYPSAGGYVSQTGFTQGTVADALVPPGNFPSGVKAVKVRISTNSFTSFWTGSSWTATSNTWFNATLSPATTAWWLPQTPWVTNVTFAAEAYAIDNTTNTQVVYSTASFTADFTPPFSTITVPSQNVIGTLLTSVSGTAEDTAPGLLSKVQLSYFDKSSGKYYDPSVGTFTSDVELFSTATVVGNTWTASGSNLPNFPTSLSGITYDVFAQAVDAANNGTVKPGSPTIPPSQSTYIEFKLQTPAPVTTITQPNPLINVNYTPSNVVMTGTALIGATTVQVLIQDCGLDQNCAAPNLAWNGSAFVSTSTFNGFVGVSGYDGTEWQITLPVASWVGNQYYKVTAKGINQPAGGIPDPTPPSAIFIVDSSAPTGGYLLPDSRVYQNSMPTLSATASDPTPGTIQSVVFRVARGEDPTKLWNWQTSTFTVISGAATDLTAAFNAGAWSYTTDYFQINTGTGAWQNGHPYIVHEIMTDLAGNTNDFVHPTFTFDIAAPTATIVVPQNGLAGIKTLPVISGTAADNNANVNVKVALYSPTDGRWYDGSGFNVAQSTPNFLPVTTLSPNATSWTFTVSNPDLLLLDHRKYTIVAQATDVAGNIQSTYGVGTSSLTITMDRSAPTVAITPPPNTGASYRPENIGESGSATRFQGTAADQLPNPSGLNQVQIQLSYVSGGNPYYWDGNINQFSSYTVTGVTAWYNAGGTSWIYTKDIVWPTDASHAITLSARGVDNASLGDATGGGNVSAPVSVSFNVDIASPTGSIAWPSSDATLSSATLQMTGPQADDLSGVSLTQVEVSTGLGASKYYWTGSSFTLNQTWITTTTAPTWFYTISNSALAPGNGSRYYLRAQLTDVAGNVFDTPVTTFTYNTTAPTIGISTPVNNGFYSAVQISTPFGGAASPSGAPNVVVSTIILTLQDLTVGTSYYNGSSWISGAATFPAQGTVASWSFNNAALTFVNDHQYQLTATATDSSQVSASSNTTFVYDVQKPTSTVTSPNTAYVTAWTTISGTANDKLNSPTYPSGLPATGVSVAIQQVGGSWWNGSAFSGVNPAYQTAAFVGMSSGAWSYTLPAGLQNALVSGTSYYVVSRSTDNAGNTEFGLLAGNIPGGTGFTVAYDTAPPTAVITLPVLASTSGVTTFTSLAGTASGDLGVSNVKVALQNLDSGLWMDNTTNFGNGSITFLPVTYLSPSATSWAYTPTGLAGKFFGNEKYLLVAEAISPSGLTQNTFTVGASSIQVIIDTAAPSVVITRPSNGASYRPSTIGKNSGNTLLAGTVNDLGAYPAGTKDYQILLSYVYNSDTYYYDGTVFSSNTVTWITRTNGNGAWTYPFDINWRTGESHAMQLQVRGEDTALSESGAGPGNIGTPSTAGVDIINFNLDDVPPSGAIAWPSNGTAISSATILMSGTATDDLSGVQTLAVEISTGTGAAKSCWSGSAWSAPGCTGGTGNGFISTTTTPSPWYYTIPSAALSAGSLYYLRFQVTDVAGNPFTTQVTTFTYNTTAPTVVVTTPAVNSFYSAVQVSTPFGGTASPSGVPGIVVSTMAVSITDVEGPSYFNGNTYTGGGPFYLPAQGTVSNWTFNNASLYFVNDHRYDVTARATDNSGSSAAATNRFVYDVLPPSSTITSPVPPYMSALGTISINATDNLSGALNNPSGVSTSAVTVAIKAGTNWWSGSNFNSSDPAYLAASTTAAPGTWSYAIPANLQNALVTGQTYRIISRAADNVGNTEFPVGNSNVPAGVGVMVLYDSATVVSNVGFPLNGGYYQTVSSFSGTANDTPQGSGVSEVDVALIDTLGHYWSGGSWALTSNCGTGVNCANPWLSASFVGNSSGTWTYNSLSGAFSSNVYYRVFVRGLDRAGNVPANPNFVAGGVRFNVDSMAPSSVITSPSDGAIMTSGITALSGTANDTSVNGSGVQTIQIRIGRFSDGAFLNPQSGMFLLNDQTSMSFPLGAAPIPSGPASYTWTQSGVLLASYFGDNKYNVESQATDNAGNVETAYSTITFIVDSTPPQTTISQPAVNNAYSVSQPLTNITGTSNDPNLYPSGVAQVQLSIAQLSGGTTYYFNGSSFLPTSTTEYMLLAASTAPWSYWATGLGAGNLVDGATYRIHAIATDIAGNIDVVTATSPPSSSTRTLLFRP